jgi:hypothetical protein
MFVKLLSDLLGKGLRRPSRESSNVAQHFDGAYPSSCWRYGYGNDCAQKAKTLTDVKRAALGTD